MVATEAAAGAAQTLWGALIPRGFSLIFRGEPVESDNAVGLKWTSSRVSVADGCDGCRQPAPPKFGVSVSEGNAGNLLRSARACLNLPLWKDLCRRQVQRPPCPPFHVCDGSGFAEERGSIQHESWPQGQKDCGHNCGHGACRKMAQQRGSLQDTSETTCFTRGSTKSRGSSVQSQVEEHAHRCSLQQTFKTWEKLLYCWPHDNAKTRHANS